MRIQMKGLASGPDGHMRPGEVHDVDDEVGRQLVAQFEAVPHDGPITTDPEAETADAPEGGESASLKSRKKRA